LGDYVITMGCGDVCPSIAAAHREDWDLPDPRDMPPDQFNAVRDEIERRVRRLIERGALDGVIGPGDVFKRVAGFIRRT
jgi:protein-tyrosine-phosphatase